MEFAHRLISTRGGTLLLAWLAAIIAGVAVFVYVQHYRNSVQAGGEPATVLVAKRLIPKGTPGELIATMQLFQAQRIRESQLRDGAFVDTHSLSGKVAKIDIKPGEQLTASAFGAGATTLAAKLIAGQRAITLPIDAAHGMIGQIHTGDHVDVYAGFNVVPVDSLGRPLTTGGQSRPVLRLIMQDIPVLDVEKSGGGISGSSTSNVTLRATTTQAAQLAFTADNGKLWFVLRPPTGAKPSSPNVVSAETLLLGVPPIVALHSFGGRR